MKKKCSTKSQGQQSSRKNTYKVLCAWCGKTIRYVDYADSHGICDDCYRRVLDDTRSNK